MSTKFFYIAEIHNRATFDKECFGCIKTTRKESFTYQEYIPPCPDNGGEIPGPILDLQIPTETTCSNYPNGEWRTGTGYIKQADKNDGVVTTHSVLWSADDTFNDPNNRFFSDIEIDENGNDVGGYNHFELRHYYRPYSLPGNGPNGFAFEKGGRNDSGVQFGDKNPSMEFVENWLRDLNPNN